MKFLLNPFLWTILCVSPSFGQAAFLGLKADVSSRPEVERVLSRPLKQVSPTLIEYASHSFKLAHSDTAVNPSKIYVQYREGTSPAIVERIELILCSAHRGRSVDNRLSDECDAKVSAMNNGYDETATSTLDAYKSVHDESGFKMTYYYGSPRYMVSTLIMNREGPLYEERWAFYSRELFESVAPTGNCPGLIRGDWDTDHGRMTITRIDEQGNLRGAYSKNSGTITAKISGIDSISGEWKDTTGAGTLYFRMRLTGDKEFTGTWKRTTGSGPQEGTWEGRCSETSPR